MAVAALSGALTLAGAAPAWAVSENVELVKNLPEVANATAINFLQYDKPQHRRDGLTDVMFVTGRFGLKSYSLADPANPRLLDEITAEELRLPGDPPVNFDPAAGPVSTFWQNEDMDVDRRRKFVLLSRDPRAYAGNTSSDPGDINSAGGQNVAGIYAVDAKKPGRLRVMSFKQLPTGHTTTCINGCRWLWTGGPASTSRQADELGWTFGRPIIVTDLKNPLRPISYPTRPVDLFRRDGITAYSHDVQVDDMGIAWVSGLGGTRGYWTLGRHYDPVEGRVRTASALKPIPYAGGGLPAEVVNDDVGGFEHNAWRPVGDSAPQGDPRYAAGELLLVTEEDFGPPEDACRNQGKFTIASLEGSYDGEAWRSTPEAPFRLQVVGSWSPYEQEGSRPPGGPYGPLASFCSAHYFDMRGSEVAYAWYGEGTRFLDVSDPANPTQYAYWRPEDGIVWAAYHHRGYVYTADRTRGVDILKLTPGAAAARRAGQEVAAPPPSAEHRAFMAQVAEELAADPAAGGLCYLPRQS